jgi:hypothetical protein
MTPIGTVVTCDLAPLRGGTGEDIYGILGMDFLDDYAVEIDFDAGKLRLWERAPNSWREQAEVQEIENARNCPTVELVLPGDSRDEFVVATGSNSSSLQRAL